MSSTTTPPTPSADSSTVCRIHPHHQTDHEGKVLVELVTREPSGATFVQHHRILPSDLRPFVAYFQQRLPRLTIENLQGHAATPNTTATAPPHATYGQPQAASAPAHGDPTATIRQSGHTSSQMPMFASPHAGAMPPATPATPATMSTDSLGGLAGYDKYGSSFGVCSWGPPGAAGRAAGRAAQQASGTGSAPPSASRSLVKDENC